MLTLNSKGEKVWTEKVKNEILRRISLLITRLARS